MQSLKSICNSILPADATAIEKAKSNWDSIAKPLGSLGVIEDDIVRIAGLTGTDKVDISKRAVAVMCSDNGVVARGISQSEQDVTAVVAGNMATGQTSVCRMGHAIGADVFPYDIGMATEVPGTIDVCVARSTKDFYDQPAMTYEEATRAVMHGIEAVGDLASKGYQIIATGEMGIGNTTTSSAVISVLLGCPVEDVTGRGSGLSDEALLRKIEVIKHGIEANKPDPNDALDVLAKVGGFDMAGMAGLFIGGAVHRVPIVIDGLISSAAALVAKRICPESEIAMIASHVSAECASRMVLDELGLKPLIDAGLRLGEGTGAVCAIALLDLGLRVYREMVTFEDTGIEAYVPLGGEGGLK